MPGQGKPFTNKGAVVYGSEGAKIATVDPYFDDLRIVTEQLAPYSSQPSLFAIT